MQPGIFFFVVGASGVGKDTLISGALEALAPSGRYVPVRRAITRPAGPGEDHEAISDEEYDRRLAAGEFLHAWTAHGLRYGLPRGILDDLAAGRNVVANGSRASLPHLVGRVKPLIVIEVTAPRELLRRRIVERGRETAEEVDQRLAREVPRFPEGLDVVTISNSSTVDEGIKRLIGAFETAGASMSLKRLPIRAGRSNIAFLPSDSTAVSSVSYIDAGRIDLFGRGRSIRATVSLVEPGWQLTPEEVGLSSEAFERLGLPEGTLVNIRRTPSPESQNLLRRKIDGERLSVEEYATVFQDIVEDRYPENEVAAFLLKAIQQLDDEEVIAVAKARCRFMPRIEWPAPIIVDKHSLGGIPGSRITLIVVPIVAAHGMLMPKTSSRAITSASGTADVMEATARVDLTAEDVRRVVLETGGCIVWNGRLNHSPLDDIVNAITRPLGLNSNRWSVASILSKKWTSGSTHVVVDMPYGPRAKLKTLAEAEELGRMFELVGQGLGLIVRALATDGSAAVGRGLGVALELRDVRQVLANDPAAPSDLRDKALKFAGEILAFDPEIGNRAEGRKRAEQLLLSGAAEAKFDQIRTAQGAIDPVLPGRFTHKVRAATSGMVLDVDGWHLSGLARRAGAPAEKSAGIDLACAKGDWIDAGMPLYTIHAATAAELEAAVIPASRDSGFTLQDAKVMA
jgi:thymidine phosphorylase